MPLISSILLSFNVAATSMLMNLLNVNSIVFWLQNQWLDILFALLMAIILGLAVEKIYTRFSPEPKILKNTLTRFTLSTRSDAVILLPNSETISIRGDETVLGREDFLGVASPENLLFVGKKHLKISRAPDGFFIEDMNTKNGTVLNGHRLDGSKKVKLHDGDKIVVAKLLNMEYHELNPKMHDPQT